MSTLEQDSLWRERVEQIDSPIDEIRMPHATAVAGDMDQDQEWCEVLIDGERRRIRFHDYDEVYKIPGLYEEIFYEKLKCCSPYRVVKLLSDTAIDFGQQMASLRVLDVGAGNGMVGDELAQHGVETILGIDLIEEAKQAAQRDRPGLYQDYFAADLTDLPMPVEETILKANLNCLTTVAALGFGDIPPLAFLKALVLIDTPGWVAFNIKADFLRNEDPSGFDRLIRCLIRNEFIQVQAYRRYQHRVSITGEPLYYVAMVATKEKKVHCDLLTEWGI